MEENKQYLIVKTHDSFDPEGLNIPSSKKVIFKGTYEDAKVQFEKLRDEFKSTVASRPKALNTYMLMTFSEINKNSFKVYYGCCQTNEYYTLCEDKQ